MQSPLLKLIFFHSQRMSILLMLWSLHTWVPFNILFKETMSLRTCASQIEKLESLYTEYGELSVNRDFCRKTAKSFNRSAPRAGKPVLKWAEVQSWFQSRLQARSAKPTPPSKIEKAINNSHDVSNLDARPDASNPNKANGSDKVHKEGEKLRDLSDVEFEARSARDGAWYDVERFLSHRFASSGEVEVYVRFTGFGSEEDEWVNVKKDVREQSIPLENWDCEKINVGDVMLCLQERKDQAMYYDVQISEIKRKMHDIRGCRCIFTVEYIHDKSEESVRLRRLCRIQRPDQ